MENLDFVLSFKLLSSKVVLAQMANPGQWKEVSRRKTGLTGALARAEEASPGQEERR